VRLIVLAPIYGSREISYLFFTEASFRVIDPHLDMRFFVKGELDLRRRTGRCT